MSYLAVQEHQTCSGLACRIEQVQVLCGSILGLPALHTLHSLHIGPEVTAVMEFATKDPT